MTSLKQNVLDLPARRYIKYRAIESIGLSNFSEILFSIIFYKRNDEYSILETMYYFLNYTIYIMWIISNTKNI